MEMSSVGMSSLQDTSQVAVFQPSWDEFKDFNNFVNFMESQGAHKIGLAKVSLLTCKNLIE